MTQPHMDTVRRKLDSYATRGVFRGLSEEPGRGGKTIFTFRWLLDERFTIVVDAARGTIAFKDVMPNVPARSELYADVKAFVLSRHDGALPAHRRIDPKRAEVACRFSKATVTLELTVHRNQYAYGTAKIIKLVNELFGHLSMHHMPYLWDNFDVPAE